MSAPVVPQPLRFAVTGYTPALSRNAARLAIMLPESRSVARDIVDFERAAGCCRHARARWVVVE